MLIGRRDLVVAWLVATVTLGVAAATVVVHLAVPDDAPARPELVGSDGPWAALDAVGLAALGLVVLRRGGVRTIGWLMIGFGLFWSLDGFCEAYVAWAVTPDDVAPGATEALWFWQRAGAFLPLGIFLPFLLYPTGRFLPGAWRGLSWAAASLLTAGCAMYLIRPAPALDTTGIPEALDLEAGGLDQPWVVPLSTTLNSLAVLSALVTVAVVVVRHRRSAGVERDRVRWLLWGVVVELLLIGLTEAIGAHGMAAFSVIVLVPAVAVTIGIVDPRRIGIDALLGATLVYGGVGALIVGVDLLALAVVTDLAGDSLDRQQVVVIVLLVSALVYNPLRAWAWRAVRRLLFGRRGDRYAVVSDLASRLEQGAAADRLGEIADSIAEAFSMPYVGVELDGGHGEVDRAEHGRRPVEVRTLPITYRDEEVGRLVLPARGLRAGLTRADERLLSDLVRQVATAVRAERLAEALQESREQLVLAREEERRRIRRDLHDGLGPSLGGLVFRLESARLQVAADPAAAEAAIGAGKDLAQEIIADVRRLVHDLRPPALDDLGLVGAVRQLCSTSMAPTVDVEAAVPDELPAAVEVAAYRIVAEAVANVWRHADARRASVVLRSEGDDLLVEVADDGRGVAVGARSGVGVLSLRERAAELGGRSTITCPAPGGTVVRAWLPLRTGA